MIIKQGYYQMRNGEQAKIEVAPQDCTGIYPIHGTVGAEQQRWCKNGRYSAYPEDHELDLMHVLEIKQ